MDNYVKINYSGNFAKFLYLDSNDDKQNILDLLMKTINRKWITRIYLREDEQVYVLYTLRDGFNFENINRLYNYYDKNDFLPFIMELKLLK